MNKFTTTLNQHQTSPLDNGAFLGLHMLPEQAERTLFVADLPRGTSYLELANLFEESIGQCQISIKRPLFRDFYYAYVQFKSTELAKKALEVLRFPEIKGKKCRLLPFSKSNNQSSTYEVGGSTQGSSQANGIFVKGFGQADWTHEKLFNHFSKFGTITSAKVSITADHKSRGYGFVQFANAQDAQKAVEEMDNFELPDDKGNLSVSEYIPSKDRGVQKSPSYNNLYVKDFPDKEISDDEFRKVFEQFGPIISAVIMKDDEQKSKGFGFVCFEQPEHAKLALTSLEEKGWYVKVALSKEQRQAELQKKNYQFKRSMQFLNLVIKNLDPQATEGDLNAMFSQFGEVKNVKINVNQNNENSNTGFVCFSDREAARQARDNINGTGLHNRVISVNFCEPKEQRKIHLEEVFDKRAYEQRQIERNMSNTNNNTTDTLVRAMGLFLSIYANHGNHQNHHHHGGHMNGNSMGSYHHQSMRSQSYNRPAPNQAFQMNGPNINTTSNGGMNNYQQLPQQPHHQMQINGQQKRQYQNNGSYRHKYRNNSMQHGNNQLQNNNRMPMPATVVQTANPTMPAPPAMQVQGNNVMQQQATAQMTPNMSEDMMYMQKIHGLFQSQQFVQGSPDERKTMIGNIIFHYVEQLVGNENAPKITGMIIDLPAGQLNQAVSQYESLKVKALSALELLKAHTNTEGEALDNNKVAADMQSQTATSITSV